jgi:hypothetical protein
MAAVALLPNWSVQLNVATSGPSVVKGPNGQPTSLVCCAPPFIVHCAALPVDVDTDSNA